MNVCCKSVLHQEAIMLFFFFRLPFNMALKVLSPWLNSSKCVSGGECCSCVWSSLNAKSGLFSFLAGLKGNKQTRPGWSGALGNYHGPDWCLGLRSWLLKYIIDAVPGLPVLTECSLVCDIMTFWLQLTTSPCPTVHFSQWCLSEDAESKVPKVQF